MVTKDEEGRYFRETIELMTELLDGVLVYDDQSADKTTDIAWNTRAFPVCRPDNVPSFLEDESAFRQAAWNRMEQVFSPDEGDWILTLDADEIIVPGERQILDDLTIEAESKGFLGIWLPIWEIWQAEPLARRVDGYWASITGLRLVTYRKNGVFPPKAMGGGSVPSYVQDAWSTGRMKILHFGYMKQEDREAKYERYKGRAGHNPKHIDSILQTPELQSLDI